jgi:sugar/nucleoside kinase (ribokinase family)
MELAAIAGSRDPVEGMRRLANGRTRVVAKLGAEGAMTLEEGEVVHVPAFPVKTVDTTGAGDSFNAGFLHRWLQGAPVLDCLRLGAACGALSTLGLGGTGAQPTLEEAEALAGAARS